MEVITTSTALKKKIKQIIKSSDFVTIDTEFVREKTYYATLGLIQVGFGEEEFAIDPIGTNIDLDPLNELLTNKNIVKVLHACGQDIEIFYNLFGEIPNNVFDTQVAAKLLGFGESISYGKLVEHYEKVKLDKSTRYTDWTKRPLKEDQIEYALNDVSYLKDVYLKMISDLEKKDRLSWALEEMEKLDDENLYFVDPDECWRKLKIKGGDKKYLALIKSLARWREHTAQVTNRPRGWIMKDDGIQEIASIKPKEVNALKGLRFFRFDEKTATELIGVVDYGLNEETPPEFEKKISVPYSRDSFLTLLRIILKDRCSRQDIAPSVVATADDLKKIALGTLDEKLLKGWRYEVFGKYAEKLMKGELAITADKNELILIEPDYSS